MSEEKEIFKIAMTILLVVVISIFVIGGAYLGYKYIFLKPSQDVSREVYEHSKSYVHGKIQDLANYYEEYNNADLDEKESIRNVIIMQFANFDINLIDNLILRSFLIETRGY